jgi:hypothetical protein
LIVAAVAAFSSAQADVIHVDDDNCPGPGNGTEGDPYCSIQTAIDNVVDTDEIVVSPGTYLETIDFLGKAITVRSSDGSAVTTIDGNGANHVVTCVNGEGLDTVLDGFTITDGNAEGLFSDNRGGGMYIEECGPTVTNCIFTANTAYTGGGMCVYFGSPTIIDCTFLNNTAAQGGGLRAYESSPTVMGCRFYANDGGGARAGPYSEAVFLRCRFIGNTATQGGGLNCGLFSNVTITECIFGDNAGSFGGGLVIVESRVHLERCAFVANSGGGMYASDDRSLEIVNCLFVRNTGAAGLITPSRDLHLVNCTFAANEPNALQMTSPPWLGSFAALQNCILWNNGAEQIVAGFNHHVALFWSDFEGGWSGQGSNNIDADPLFGEDTPGTWTAAPSFDSSSGLTTLTDDSASFPPGGLIGQSILPSTDFPMFRTVVATNTETSIAVVGEIWSLFVTEGTDYVIEDYRLVAGSPCIDSAHNWAIAGLADTDLDGNPRFADGPAADTGCGIPVVVDMGAYEYQGDPFPVKLGDIDGNGTVNVNDFLLLLAAWGPCLDDCCLADLDLSGDVAISDFLLLLANWG